MKYHILSNLRNKKAQSAMEYLMTYGWAILIIIVVVAALFAMGVFSTKQPETTEVCVIKYCARTSPFNCLDFYEGKYVDVSRYWEECRSNNKFDCYMSCYKGGVR